MKKGLFVLALCPLLTLFGAASLLAQGETHPAHVHGEAALNLSVAADSIQLDLESPLASFISFEHVPSTDAQAKEFDAMDTLVKKPEGLISIPKDYGCHLIATAVKYEDSEEEGHGHGDEGDAHADGGHDHGDEDGDHDHEEGEAHRDLDAAYAFKCAKVPDKGQIDLAPLFKAFPLLKSLHVQAVTPKGQKAQDLTPKSAIVKW
jgi:hypothetical protein